MVNEIYIPPILGMVQLSAPNRFAASFNIIINFHFRGNPSSCTAAIHYPRQASCPLRAALLSLLSSHHCHASSIALGLTLDFAL
jgi:hypothetical protein